MKTSRKQEFKFPVGYERFHKKQLFNFQLNRPYSFGYARFEDMKEAGQKIKTFSDWKKEMLKLSEKAISEERLMNAAFYYRAAEFYIKSNDPEKGILYDKFIDLFYKVFENAVIEKHKVPFEEAFLPAMRIPAATEKKGTILIHGGFDSFIEEFYSMMTFFSNHGYEVIGFEGPGQGAARRKFGLPITYEWEKPTKAILDYFQLEDVTLLGISMGGWLCLRASAFESRIKRVIATGHAIDYMQSMHPLLQKLHFWCLEHYRDFMNRMAVIKFEKRDGMASWMVDHMKYITKKSKPLDALEFYLLLNEKNIHSELVKQDVLILSGRKDHFIPAKMHDMQLKALVNAKSVTDRIFTEKEQAQNHCQTGNIKLALDTMIDWIESMNELKSNITTFVIICIITILFNSCNQNRESIEVPEDFKSYLQKTSEVVDYKEITPFHGAAKEKIPSLITKNEALEDIEMFEYLLNTSYSGLEFWEHEGVDFKSHFSNLRDFVNEKDTINVNNFENDLSKILKQINDGHIAINGTKYNWAYKHKNIYFCDVLIEQTNKGLFKVIDSRFDIVEIGDLFTQEDGEKYLFKTLSAKDKNHYLIGFLSYDATFSKQLSFNNKTIAVPFHKSRLMYAKFDDSQPFYVERQNDIPVVRVSSFHDKYYPDMKNLMKLGNTLKKEKRIILNLFYNGGGSSLFPQAFIKNLNDQSEWEMSWAILTSPAITQYFAKYDLKSIPNISPNFRHTIITNRKKHKKYLTSPMKSWEFGKKNNQQQPFGSYNGTLVILTNRRVLSAAEAMIGYSKSVKNRIIVGENTGGVAQFSDTQNYYLPNSKLIIILPRQILSIPDFEECVGFLPDLWLDSMEPVKEVLNWLNDPENYQFKFACSYNEMIDKNNLAPLLPVDLKIITPSLKLPKTLRAFSGEWFGITDGILDQLLVVESINANMEVKAVYSWGVAYQWNINKPGWQRYNGKFQNKELILSDEKNTVKITYMFNTDGTLHSIYQRPGIFSQTTLTRLDK